MAAEYTTISNVLGAHGVVYITDNGKICDFDHPRRVARIGQSDFNKSVEMSTRIIGETDASAEGFNTLTDALRTLAGYLMFSLPCRPE